MSLYAQFATDPEIEADKGVDIELMDGVSITIKRAGGANAAFAKALADRTKKHRRAITNGTVDGKLLEGIMLEVYADTVVKGWRGVTDRAGKKLSFNRDNFIQLMTDLPEVWAVVQDEANRVANYRPAEIEADLKN